MKVHQFLHTNEHQVLQDIGGGILVFGDGGRENSSIGGYTEGFNRVNALDFNNISCIY
jgi:hypothetical protein